MYIRNFIRHLDDSLIRIIALLLVLIMIVPIELSYVIDLSSDDSISKTYALPMGGSGSAGSGGGTSASCGIVSYSPSFAISLVDGNGKQFAIGEGNTVDQIMDTISYGYIGASESTFIFDSFITNQYGFCVPGLAYCMGGEMIYAEGKVATVVDLHTRPSKPALQWYDSIYTQLKTNKAAFTSSGWQTLLNQSHDVTLHWRYILGRSATGQWDIKANINNLWNPEGYHSEYNPYGTKLIETEDDSLKAEAYYLDMLYSLYWITDESCTETRAYIKQRIKRIVDGSFNENSFIMAIYPVVHWFPGNNSGQLVWPVTRTYDALNFYLGLADSHRLNSKSYQSVLRSDSSVPALSSFYQYEKAYQDDMVDYPNKARISHTYNRYNYYSNGMPGVLRYSWYTYWASNISENLYTSGTERIHEYLWLNNNVDSDTGGSKSLLYGEFVVIYDNSIKPTATAGKLVAEPDDKLIQVTNSDTILGENVEVTVYPGITDAASLQEWENIFTLCSNDSSFAGFDIQVKNMTVTSNTPGYATSPQYDLTWPSGTVQHFTLSEMKSIIQSNSKLLNTTHHLTYNFDLPVFVDDTTPVRIEFVYTCDLSITCRISGSDYELGTNGLTDPASFILTPPPPELYASYMSTPEAYSELKNFGVGSDGAGTLHEDYEVMSGIPTTRQLYYSAGGSEFIIDVSFEYSKAERAVRSYTSFLRGTKCEFYEDDSFNKGAACTVTTDSSVSTPANYVLGTFTTGTDATSGVGSWTDSTIQCNSELGWDGTITYVIEGDAQCGAENGTETHHQCAVCGGARIEDSHTSIDTAPYDAALAAMNALAATLGDTVVHWESASDKVDREAKWSCSVASETDFDDHTTKGSDGTAGCGEGHKKCGKCCNGHIVGTGSNQRTEDRKDGCGCKEGAAHSAGSKCSGSHKWKITLTATLVDHCICGPCCSHYLPDIYDTWSQDFVYDSMKIVDVHIWRIDQAAASGLESVIGPGVDEEVEYTVSAYNSSLAGPYENPNNLADGVVGAYIRTNYPTVFYNIAMKNSNDLAGNTSGESPDRTYRNPDGIGGATETSLVGRVRYNVSGVGVGTNPGSWGDAAQHDEVFYDLGTRTDTCDGMANGYPGEVDKVSACGHEIYQSKNSETYAVDTSSWGKGFLYESYTVSYDSTERTWTVDESAKTLVYAGSNGTIGSNGNTHVTAEALASASATGASSNTARVANAAIYDTENNDVWKPNNTSTHADANDYWSGYAVTGTAAVGGWGGSLWPIGQTEYPLNTKDFLVSYTDAVDKQTEEYEKLLEKRQQTISAYMITDFLILQTTSGDQCVLYFQKEVSGLNDNDEDMTVEVALKTLEVEGEEMYEANPYSCANWDDDAINIGGYNGKYNHVQTSATYTPNLGYADDKYKGSGNYSTYTATIFDREGHNTVGLSDDPALTLVQPARPTQRLMMYSLPLNIIMDLENQAYLTYGLNSEVFWTNYMHWTDINSGTMLIKDNPNTPLSYSTDESVLDTTYDFNVEVAKPAVVTEERVIWGQDNKDETHKMLGYVQDAYYDLAKTKELNPLIIHDPISVVNTALISIPNSRDQRYASSVDTSAVAAMQDAFIGCPHTAADCEFAVVNCQYANTQTLAVFPFNSTSKLITNSVNLTGTNLSDGYSQSGGKLTGTDGAKRVTIPIADCLEISYQQSMRVEVSATVKLSSLADHSAGVVGERISQMLFSFEKYGVYVSPEGKIGFITKDRQYKESTTVALSTGTNYDIRAIFKFNSLDGCEIYVNGTKIAMSKGQANDVKITSADVGSNFYIGSMAGIDYGFRGTMGPVTIKRLAGTMYHTDECYVLTEIHPAGLNTHVHTLECLENGNTANSYEYYSNRFETVGMTPTELRTLFGDEAYEELFDLTLKYKEIDTFNSSWVASNISNVVNAKVSAYSNKFLIRTTGYEPSFVYYESIPTSEVNQLRLKLDNNTEGTKVRVYFSSTNSFSSSTPYVEASMQPNKTGQTVKLYLANNASWTGSKTYFKIVIPSNSDKYYAGNVQISKIEWIGKNPDTVTFEYTGTRQEYTALLTGYYLIEAWGAQGGGTNGGKGGYTKGVIRLNEGEKIYNYVGGSGTQASAMGTGGGYNGGGQAGVNGYGGGGMTFWSSSQNGAATSGVTKTGSPSVTGYADCVIWTGETTLSASGYSHSSSSATWTNVYTFTATKTGPITFLSKTYEQDPVGRILVNGVFPATSAKNDDNSTLSTKFGGTGGVNFGLTYNVTAGQVITLQATTFSSNTGGKKITSIVFYGDTNTNISNYSTGYEAYGSWSSTGTIMVAGGGGGASRAATVSIPDATDLSPRGVILGAVTRDFGYTGSVQTVTLSPGTYKFEAWGGAGGDARDKNAATMRTDSGGGGGYTYGSRTITTPTTYYIYVGGRGENVPNSSSEGYTFGQGGWNGGAPGGTELSGETWPENGAGGGGMTHISTSSTDNITSVGSIHTSNGDSTTYTYTGSYQTVTLQPGTYKIEAYGGSGGQTNGGYEGVGGLGGYTAGTITLTKATTLYLYVGHQGASNGESHIAFNGSGYGAGGGGDGGGASDVRLVAGGWNGAASLQSRILVAGGGGGRDGNSSGGAGGGLIGQDGLNSQSSGSTGRGGTQTAGGTNATNSASNGAFGTGGGANINSSIDAGGGGGGWYGGAAGWGGHDGGGGGSSYVSGYSDPVQTKQGQAVYDSRGSTKNADGSLTITDVSAHCCSVGACGIGSRYVQIDIYGSGFTGRMNTMTRCSSYGQVVFSKTITDTKATFIIDKGAGNESRQVSMGISWTATGAVITSVESHLLASSTVGDYLNANTSYRESQKINGKYVEFSDVTIQQGVNSGDGKIVITPLKSMVVTETNVFDTSAVVMVAGGGGGAASFSSSTQVNGGDGGGGNLAGTRTNTVTWPGTSSTGYACGLGQYGYSGEVGTNNGATGGAGGGYYGGSWSDHSTTSTPLGGAGGSGYVNTTVFTATGGVTGQNKTSGQFGGYGHVRITQTSAYQASLGLEQSVELYYSGTGQAVTLPAGKYKIEAYGASGGGALAGQGGYTSASLVLDAQTTLYAYIGGAGYRSTEGSNYAPATFNGGGDGGSGMSSKGSHLGGSGGGATDIRITSGNWNSPTSLQSRLIVAGGGGGSGCASAHNPGHGGGLTGATTVNSSGNYAQASAYGGSQTAAGSGNGQYYRSGTWHTCGVGTGGFGYGANAVQCAAGGGGGYYGGGSNYTAGGGGGSSYVSGFTGCDTTYLANQKINGKNVEFTDVVMQQGGNVGNGYIRITYICGTKTLNIPTQSGGYGGGAFGGTSGASSNLGINLSGALVKTESGETWVRVLYQNIRSNTNYFTASEAAAGRYVNNSNPGKFMILDILEQFRGDDGKFKLMLDYPNQPQYDGVKNIWKQSTNPWSEQITNGYGSGVRGVNVDGFESISFPMANGYYDKGIEYNGYSCVLDGSMWFNNWWLCIGIINGSYSPTNGDDGNYTMPGPIGAYGSKGAAECELWVAVPASKLGQLGGFQAGYGESSTYEVGAAGGGGGWQGGKSWLGAGDGGSGYIGSRLIDYRTSTGTNYLKATLPNIRTGNGAAKITFIEAVPTTFPTVNEIMEILDKIPPTSPLIVCTHELNRHVCDHQCRIIETLNCLEPHHSGNHYAGDEMCYDACNDDAKHRPSGEADAGDRDFESGNFINLDWGFKVYFNNTGNFAQQTDLYGLGALTTTRGKGYTSNMDTSDKAGIYNSSSHITNMYGPVANQGWTRLKQIRFPINVIYKDNLYLAGEWITLGYKGYYEADPGAPYDERNWSQYGDDQWYSMWGMHIDGTDYNGGITNYVGEYKYEFYCVEANHEKGSCIVGVRSFAINNSELRVDQGQDNSYPYYTTNRSRTGRNYESKHSDFNIFIMDVVGRIGNLVLIDTGDYRFSNLFKKATENIATVDDPVYHTVSSGDVVTYNGGVKTGTNTIKADDFGEGAALNSLALPAGTYRIYITGTGLTNSDLSIKTSSSWEDSGLLPGDGGMNLTKTVPPGEVPLYELEGPGIPLDPGKYKMTIDGENLSVLENWRAQNDSASIEAYVTSKVIEDESVTFNLNITEPVASFQIVASVSSNQNIVINGAELSMLNLSASKELVGTSSVSTISNTSTEKIINVKLSDATVLDIAVMSNGATITVNQIGIQDMKTSGGTNYIVEGIIKEVDVSLQNVYLTHPKDLRGTRVKNNPNRIDTYSTVNWAKTATYYSEAGSGLPLDSTKNNIEVLRSEPMLVGYDAYFSIATLGDYYKNDSSFLQLTPEYYALDTTDSNPTPIPVDVYILYNKNYYPVNIWGLMTKNGGKSEDCYTWGGSGSGYTLATVYNFVVNLNWADEYIRRMTTAAETYMTNYLKTALASFDENGNELYLDVPTTAKYIMGNSQFMQLNGKARTFIGGETTASDYVYQLYHSGTVAGNTIDSGGKRVLFNLSKQHVVPDPSTASGYRVDKNCRTNSILYYDTVHGIYYNPEGRIGATEWWQEAQRWHATLSLPSSAVFVRAGQEPTVDNVNEFQTRDYVILAGVQIVALGEVWNLKYRQTNQQISVMRDANSTTPIAIDIPDEIYIPGTSVKHEMPPIIAVYQTVANAADDVDIVSTH